MEILVAVGFVGLELRGACVLEIELLSVVGGCLRDAGGDGVDDYGEVCQAGTGDSDFALLLPIPRPLQSGAGSGVSAQGPPPPLRGRGAIEISSASPPATGRVVSSGFSAMNDEYWVIGVCLDLRVDCLPGCDCGWESPCGGCCTARGCW